MPFWPRSETKSGQLCNAKPVGNRELFEVYQPVQWACSQEVLCISMYTYTHNCCLIVGLLVQVSTKWKMCACVPVPCRIHLVLAVPQAFLSRWCQETTSDAIWSWRSRTWLDHHPILGGYKPSKIIEKTKNTFSSYRYLSIGDHIWSSQKKGQNHQNYQNHQNDTTIGFRSPSHLQASHCSTSTSESHLMGI